MRRRPCLIFSFIIFIIIFFYLLLPAEAQAFQVLFQDDFNDGDAAGWLEYSPWGYWKVENGEYQGSTVLQGSPESPSYSVAGDRSWTNYAVSARVKGEEGVDKVILFRVNESNNAYLLDLRSQFFSGGKDLVLVQRLGLGTSGTRIIKGAPYVNYSGQWYELKAVVENTEAGVVIKAYVDGNLVLEYLDTVNPLLTGAVGFEVWPGGYSLPTLGLRTTTSYDIITVTSLAPEPDPVILLPGLGASWNKDALICNAEVGWDEWEMTPGIHHYDGIIQTFQEALGDDFHVFFYDWTKPVDRLADDLKTFIDEVVNPPPETEIDLVGHSLGGLVARAYLQKNPTDHGVDQLLTLGTPHQGIPQVYYAWEGANFKKLLHPIEAYGAMLLIIGRRGPLESLVAVVQEEMPSLKDLLPIFPYLKRNSTGEIIPLGSMSQRNEWLPGLFPILADLLSRFNPFFGLSGDTTRWLRVVPRGWRDSLRGMWQDGRPIEQEYEMGDERVLAESAGLDGASETELPGLNHSQLVTAVESQEEILNVLGIPGVSPTPGEADFSPRLLVAILLPTICPLAEVTVSSLPPGIRITDPLGMTAGEGVPTTIPDTIYRPQDQLILIPGAVEGNYLVEVIGNPGEGYHLVVAGMGETEDVWIDRREEIGGSGADSYPIEYSQDPGETVENLLQLAKSRLQELNTWLRNYSDSRYLSRITSPRIRAAIRQIERAERYLSRGGIRYELRVALSIRLAVRLLDNLQRNLSAWQNAGFIPTDAADKILFETTQVRDYLLQALDLLGE